MLPMPWQETDSQKERVKLIIAIEDEGLSISEACRIYGVSRKTGHKWLNRYQEKGIEGLFEQSRAHHSHALQTPTWMIEALLSVKHLHRNWGPKKVRAYLVNQDPTKRWPAPSTIGSIFDQHGLVKKRRRKRGGMLRSPLSTSFAANEIWCVDFKGQFTVGRRYMYPLTLTDHHSRFLLGCQGLDNIKGKGVIEHFFYWFHEYGLPRCIRSDNGAPFACASRTGLTKLATWWVKLGIKLERIRPGNPQENGRHERFHRTLKLETASPPQKTFKLQQQRFDDFAHEYNNLRPHEALGGDVPSKHYDGSRIKMPHIIKPPEYRSDIKVRRVRSTGEIKLCGKKLFVSNNLVGEWVGVEELDGDKMKIYFYQQPIILLDLNTFTVINDKCNP